MTTHLYLAPAGAGKTAYLISEARKRAQPLSGLVWICTSTVLQARSWRQRLAEAGGGLGIRIQIFDELYRACLSALGEAYVELSEPVQYRLLQGILDDLPLDHYAPLRRRPGFVHLLQRLIGELKAAEIDPDHFKRAAGSVGGAVRLVELAEIYLAYQNKLQAAGWADRAGLGWLATLALSNPQKSSPLDGGLLIVDGFDNFTQIQISMLAQLARRTDRLIITLTGDLTAEPRDLVHQRFLATRASLEHALGVKAAPLPTPPPTRKPALDRLEARLYDVSPAPIDGTGTVTMIEAADRAAEVRAALRWLKARLIQDEARPGEVALLARSMMPYRPFIGQIGAEFGLPLQFLDGLPLRSNPAVAALLDLLRLILPEGSASGEPVLPRRLVIEAWQSPYFDWLGNPDAPARAIGIMPGDANQLDAVARQGRVIGGYRQWVEALTRLIQKSSEVVDREEAEAVALPPEASQVQKLLEKFEWFVKRIQPPEQGSYRDYVAWLEDLVGPDTTDPDPADTNSLRILTCIRGGPETSARDLAAYHAFKEVLRGLVWAEAALKPDQTVTFTQFLEDVLGAVEAASYRVPMDQTSDAILVADVVQSRGVPFRAVAVLGLAEGQFPAVLGEDPLLRDADRRQLAAYGIALDPSTASAEVEFFYETINSPWEQLCLTRPRLADNGSPWPASPYWEEVNRLVEAEQLKLGSESAPSPDRAASWPELLESLSVHAGYQDLRAWAAQVKPERCQALEQAAELLQLRQAQALGSPYEGDLRHLTPQLDQQLGPDQPWSASRLETYRSCPFMFFIGSLLKLEPRFEPVAGLDARQLGNIYHRLFEHVYQAASDPTDLDELLTALAQVAEQILDEAPEREGFRETAWWGQTRVAIVEAVKRSLSELAGQAGDFRPLAYEQAFFDEKILTIGEGASAFRIRGFIDRVDQSTDGSIRIIDYKTSAPYQFTDQSVREGKKLQLPLYALAARDALNLGKPVDGFYWHARHAQASKFTLQTFKSETGEVGPEAAFNTVIELAQEAVTGARAGHFTPKPPPGGCPSYCPAATFCWHYQPGFG